MFFISQQLALFVLRIIENTKRKCDFNISNLTNSGLLTIERHYTSTGSSAFLHFRTSEAQDIGTANAKMRHQREKALDLQGLSAIF